MDYILMARRLLWLGFLLLALGSAGAGSAWAEETLIQDVKLSRTRLEPGNTFALLAECRQFDIALSAEFEGREIAFTALPGVDDWRVVFIAVPLECGPGEKTIMVRARRNEVHESRSMMLLVVPPAKQRIEHLTISGYQKFDFSPESRMMVQLRSKAENHYWSWIGNFGSPLPEGDSCDNFGVKRSYNHGYRESIHRGVDIKAASGTRIVAPAPGKVILARNFTAHGKTIMLDHGFGIVTTFLHQSRLLVKTGMKVDAGQVVGEVGATGAATGPHLHFQINLHGVPVDPADFAANLKIIQEWGIAVTHEKPSAVEMN